MGELSLEMYYIILTWWALPPSVEAIFCNPMSLPPEWIFLSTKFSVSTAAGQLEPPHGLSDKLPSVNSVIATNTV